MTIISRLRKTFAKGVLMSAATLSVVNPSYAADKPQDISSSLQEIESNAQIRLQLYTRIEATNEILSKIGDSKYKTQIEVSLIILRQLENALANSKLDNNAKKAVNDLLGRTIKEFNGRKYAEAFNLIETVGKICRDN